MRAMRAEQFNGYEALKLVELPKPTVTDGKVLVRITAAGVTPLDHTILFGNFHIPEAPLVLGNEGAGVVEEGGGTDFPAGSRVMFWGGYGAFKDGTYREWIAVRKEDLCLLPDSIDNVSAAGIPVAYLTAQVALTLAGFRPGKTVLAPAIGGSVGNAVTQLGINDNNKGDSAGFAGHGNQCPGCKRLFDRGDYPSAIPGPCRIRSNAGVVDIGDVRGGAHNSSGFVRIGGDLQAGDVCVADPGCARRRRAIAGCRNRPV
jgi:NADPH-dependent curcumin reductase CurA